MILGTGTDLCEVAAIARAIDRSGERFLLRLYTPAERAAGAAHPRPALHFARLFAAKEACAKALGSGLTGQLGWTDMEFLPDQTDRPRATLTGGARAALERLPAGRSASVHVSWSQDAAFAMALVVIDA